MPDIAPGDILRIIRNYRIDCKSQIDANDNHSQLGKHGIMWTQCGHEYTQYAKLLKLKDKLKTSLCQIGTEKRRFTFCSCN